MASTAESVYEAILATQVLGVPWRIASNPDHRLVASFIWNRASTLSAPGSGLTTVSAITTRVNLELGQVRQYLKGKMGVDEKSGPLTGGTDPTTPPHLDLADLAKQRVSDLTAPSTKSIDRAKSYVRIRRRAIKAIVWRATALENDLWSGAAGLRDLDQTALNELLDRRLRTVERMRGNVSAHSEMFDGNPGLSFTFATAGSGWEDGLRVRMFEYPSISPLDRPTGIALNIDEGFDITSTRTWIRTDNTNLTYNTFPPDGDRVINGDITDTEPVVAKREWRMPTAAAPDWVVSPGSDSGYRIDLTPASGRTGAAAIDAMFSYQGSVSGKPERSDYWNRSWLYCDQVISALHLEALLFALRRQDPATADGQFNALVAQRPTVGVRRLTGTNVGAPVLTQTGFVALDSHLPTLGPIDETHKPDAKILMNDTEPTAPFPDAFFRNTSNGAVEQLQVGDQVKFLNSPVYAALNPIGVWGLENAIVMDVDPDPSNVLNRAAINLTKTTFQGHGTVVQAYDKLRKVLAGSLEVATTNALTEAFGAASSIFVQFGSKPNSQPLVRWAPYNDMTGPIGIDFGSTGQRDIQQTGTAPWWIPLPISTYSTNPDPAQQVVEALAAVPGSIGSPQQTEFSLRGDPTAALPQATRADIFKLAPDQDLFQKYLLFPLLLPVLESTPDDKGSWENLFEARRLGSTDTVFFRFVDADQNLVPGLFRFSSTLGAAGPFPLIQPKPRRSSP
jgi:hypothetical protein